MSSPEVRVPATASSAEPTVRVGGRFLVGFGGAWLGLWMAQLAPLQVLLPTQVSATTGVSAASLDWIPTVVAFGIVAGVGGALAVVAYPIAGALSDRTVSRFGRRRPWIAGGVLMFAVALALLGLQHDLVTETVLWALAVIGFCAASAALTAVVSDQVPAPQRGVVSTWVAAPNAIGTVLGVVLVGLVFTGQSTGYLVIAILLVVFCAPFVVRLRDAPLSRADRDAVLQAHRVSGRGRSLRLREFPDFGWALASRILIYLGNALGTALLLYYFGFALHIGDPEDFLVTAVLIYVAVTLVVAVFGGALSDRLDLRRPFVVVGGIAQGVAALLLALLPSPTTALVGAALLGLGWGSSCRSIRLSPPASCPMRRPAAATSAS
ncbi:hypothetical protein GCM10025867_42310 [Frondihabitans sucicola]|uniref:Major facilitator superfamily (MFS) profile domain-containing protein n=1 Tax=Frondihabitans sucicola TaxID=1268041 RepID=A0ABM8GU42_9MICO|nr:MFS transporter [Frondihabitans sucicola]BDZ51990.1 hypothetical protein GCM10025867_42310 [Frondihabitans sucicola]